MPDYPIIPCKSRKDWSRIVEQYSESMKEAAHTIGDHGMNKQEFQESGLFKSAIERIRGQQAASTHEKYAFIEAILEHLKNQHAIDSYKFVDGKERHDLEVYFEDGRLCCIEAKGCLDGNNTNIFVRPQNADEFVMWSLCQNPGADPRHNAWSGIHTRLGAEIVANGKRVDGLLIWDMLCGTMARPCPKLTGRTKRGQTIGAKVVPPPCIYLFPRTVPDARNNPNPPVWELGQVRFLQALAKIFRVKPQEVVGISLEVRMHEAEVERRTTFNAGGVQLHQSDWTTIRRAR